MSNTSVRLRAPSGSSTASFHRASGSEFLAFSPPDRLATFYRGWSRKEAFLKATGTGLSTELDSFDVTLGPFASLLRVGDDPAEASRWTLRDLDPGPGFAGAVAVRADRVVLKFWEGLPGF